MRVKLLIDDPAGRFKAGEIGYALPNSSSKYDYFVELSGKIKIDNFLGRRPISALRRYYFYKNEVEEIELLQQENLVLHLVNRFVDWWID